MLADLSCSRLALLLLSTGLTVMSSLTEATPLTAELDMKGVTRKERIKRGYPTDGQAGVPRSFAAQRRETPSKRVRPEQKCCSDTESLLNIFMKYDTRSLTREGPSVYRNAKKRRREAKSSIAERNGAIEGPNIGSDPHTNSISLDRPALLTEQPLTTDASAERLIFQTSKSMTSLQANHTGKRTSYSPSLASESQSMSQSSSSVTIPRTSPIPSLNLNAFAEIPKDNSSSMTSALENGTNSSELSPTLTTNATTSESAGGISATDTDMVTQVSDGRFIGTTKDTVTPVSEGEASTTDIDEVTQVSDGQLNDTSTVSNRPNELPNDDSSFNASAFDEWRNSTTPPSAVTTETLTSSFSSTSPSSSYSSPSSLQPDTTTARRCSQCSWSAPWIEERIEVTESDGRIDWVEPARSCSCVQLLSWHIKPSAANQGIVLHITHFTFHWYEKLEVYQGGGRSKDKLLLKTPGPITTAVLLLPHGELLVWVKALPWPFNDVEKHPSSFSLSYSTHSLQHMPVSLPDSPLRVRHSAPLLSAYRYMYDCSPPRTVPAYIRCDMVQQCMGGEDEPSTCPYTSDEFCPGWLRNKDKCLRFVESRVDISCKDEFRNSQLAALPVPEERELVGRAVARTGHRLVKLKVDLKKRERQLSEQSHQLVQLYQHVWYWGDGVVAHGEVALQRYGASVSAGRRDLMVSAGQLTTFSYQSEPFHPVADTMMTVCMKRAGSLNASNPQTVSLSRPAWDYAVRDQDTGPMMLSTRRKVLPHSLALCKDDSFVFVFQQCPNGGGRRTDESGLTRTDKTGLTHNDELGQTHTDQPSQTHAHESGLTRTNGSAVTHSVKDEFHVDAIRLHASRSGFKMFDCMLGGHVHYSFVCDGRRDCSGATDELNCPSPGRSELNEMFYTCDNLQLVPFEKRCNGAADCLDGTDEVSCDSCRNNMVHCGIYGCVQGQLAPYLGCARKDYTSSDTAIDTAPPKYIYPPAVLYLDSLGLSTVEEMEDGHPGCPDTHFQCRDGYCIPTFLLNNGVQDCPRGDDEGITNLRCPGFYRCAWTHSCLHPSLLCDGTNHCPLTDDERYCQDPPCPDHCTCEGLAFRCWAGFDFKHCPLLRFLDLSGCSGRNASTTNLTVPRVRYLQLLNVSSCRLETLQLQSLTQLRVLDVSRNNLRNLSSLLLGSLQELVHLNLSYNPLGGALTGALSQFLRSARLVKLQTLTMIGVGFDMITATTLDRLPQLSALDISGNPVSRMTEEEVFGKSLQVLHTDNPKLCCPHFHATQLVECHAPVDQLSSCTDLLRSDFLRVSLWILAAMALSGNTGVLIYRAFIERQGTSLAYRVLVINLSGADLLMGVFMALIGGADLAFRGRYVLEEDSWRQSGTCIAAGVLALLSSEVSALVVCLITLDRFLLLQFPFSKTLRLSRSTAAVGCGLAWVCGACLAAVPLFLPHWHFYQQNSICLPLPITRTHYPGQHFAFGVFIVLNFVLFLLVGAGQAVIYRAIRSTSQAAQKGRDSRRQDVAIARRLFLIVFTDFCCWFPVGLLGLLAAQGTHISERVYVWLAVFALPLNSAINPFLYTLNMLLQKRARAKEKERLARMMNNLQVEARSWPRDKVVEVVQHWIKCRLLAVDDLLPAPGLDSRKAEDPCQPSTSSRPPDSDGSSAVEKVTVDGGEGTASTQLSVGYLSRPGSY